MKAKESENWCIGCRAYHEGAAFGLCQNCWIKRDKRKKVYNKCRSA